MARLQLLVQLHGHLYPEGRSSAGRGLTGGPVPLGSVLGMSIPTGPVEGDVAPQVGLRREPKAGCSDVPPGGAPERCLRRTLVPWLCGPLSMERHWPGAWFHVAVGSEEQEALLIGPSRDLLFHQLLSRNLRTTETKRHGGETGDHL